jgi:Fe-S cluster assembly protein SufD
MAANEPAVAEVPSAREGLLAAWAAVAGDRSDRLHALRGQAWERFESLGFPRPGDEEWRQTPVSTIASTPFVAADAGILPAGVRLPEPVGSVRLVLVNGVPVQALSTLGAASRGLSVRPLLEALGADPALSPLLGSAVPWRDRVFAALNTALFRDGAFVDVAAGAVVSGPIEILHVAVPSERGPVAIHARLLVRVGDGAEASIVETFAAAGDGVYLTNAVTEIAAGANARVEHVRVQDEAPSAFHVASVDVRQARDSRVASHNVAFGSALARTDLGFRLEGSGAEALLYGLTVAGARTHVDHHTQIDHAVAHCPSHELYKSILWDRARSVFNGRIVVRPGAQKTDAKQSNRNLLLSDDAVVFTRPQLEIYADDVKCTHGATIGRLDESALFYLRARGLGPREARALLIRAFAGEVLEHLGDPSLRGRLEEETLRRLPAGERG